MRIRPGPSPAWSVLLLSAALAACAGRSPGVGPSLAVHEGYVVGADQVRLFFRTVGTGGDTLVFLHGGRGKTPRASRPIWRRWPTSTVLFYDQRGSGRSEAPADTMLLTVERHVADLEAVRQELVLGRVAMIGHSWGCGLAALYAAAHPER